MTEITRRESFVLEKASNFSPQEIRVLLVREGFKPLSRPGIYKILSKHDIKPVVFPATRTRRDNSRRSQ